MKKQLKKTGALLMAGAMALSMAGCGASGDSTSAAGSTAADAASTSSAAPEETTLKVYLFGQAEDFDKVVEKFEEETKDTLNIKLDVIWSDGNTHREKIPLMMANQEEADLVFDAYWMNLSTMHNQGAYASLNEYFNNPDYPGLQAAFSADYLEQVTDADGNIFAIPFTQAAEDIPVIAYRKDLADKYGITIDSDEKLEEYFQAVQADIAAGTLDMVAPFGVGGTRGFYWLDHDIYEKRASNIFSIDSSAYGIGMEMEAAVSEDGKTVLGVATMGDPDEAYPDAELHLTEWSSSPSSRDYSHDYLPAAAYILRCNLQCAGLVDSLSYWVFTDVFEEVGAGPLPFHGGFGMINLQGVKKLAFHAYRMLNALGDVELERGEGWIFTRRGDGLAAVFYHYPDQFTDAVPMSNYPDQGPAQACQAIQAVRELHFTVTGLRPGSRYRLETLRSGQTAVELWNRMGAPAETTREQEEELRRQGEALDCSAFRADETGTLQLDLVLDAWTIALLREASE